jgi:hypothetical protein
MVWVMVRYDDFSNRPTRHASTKQSIPSLLRGFIGYPRVNDVPRIPIVDEIDVHMVQPKRKGNSGPKHSCGNLEPLASNGRRSEHRLCSNRKLGHAALTLMANKLASVAISEHSSSIGLSRAVPNRVLPNKGCEWPHRAYGAGQSPGGLPHPTGAIEVHSGSSVAVDFPPGRIRFSSRTPDPTGKCRPAPSLCALIGSRFPLGAARFLLLPAAWANRQALPPLEMLRVEWGGGQLDETPAAYRIDAGWRRPSPMSRLAGA